MITCDELIKEIEQKNSHPFDPEQRDAIVHSNGPLWIVAGPGTGKTEVLVVKVLKLLCCDELEPRSIVVTTFTEKAALNIENRIAAGMMYLAQKYPSIAAIDYCQLRVGTLHSLCSDIMQEYRYQPFQNIRLMDDVEQAMFIRQYVAGYARKNWPAIREYFFPLIIHDARKRQSNSLWTWTRALSILIDRIVEDDIDLVAMKNAGTHWSDLACAFEYYESMLTDHRSCDFAHLQRHFYDFLQTGQGIDFLTGSNQINSCPINAVLVDEYQDTNPIQECIYFKLASNEPHNICVVGDDDQALYRFRGGTVDCMINFDTRCQAQYGVIPSVVSLSTNHRSNKVIVDWCNTYIESFDAMKVPGARIGRKPPAHAVPGNDGYHAAVGLIMEKNPAAVANAFAETVSELLQHSIIEDYSQCVLILPSTKDSQRNARPFLSALSQFGIPVYNPRAKTFPSQREVQELLGAFISIIDPSLFGIDRSRLPDIFTLAKGWLDAYRSIENTHPLLKSYIDTSLGTIQNNSKSGQHFAEYAAGIVYRILSFEPFSTYQTLPEKDLRLSKVTRVFESFISLNGRALKADVDNPNSVDRWWLHSFYMSLCGYLCEYGMDDDEDDEVICPKGYLPIMTIHQSKGLEFDFVFAGNLGRSVSADSAHKLEYLYSPFRKTPVSTTHSLDTLAWQDEVRKHFVTYSRAKNALVLLATTSQLKKQGNETASFSQNGGIWFRNNYQLI